MSLRTWIVPSLFAAACGGGGGSGNGGADANNHGGSADAAAPDAGSGIVAFPLTSLQGGIAYTAEVTIGGAQSYNLVVDTGSTTLGVASTSCTSCDVTPEYAPGATAVDQHDTATTQYGDGSTWTGENFSDSVALKGDPASITMRLSAIQTQDQFFRFGNADQGIIGFGPTALAISGTDSFVDQRMAAGHADEFAFQFCPNSGQAWLGDFDPAFMVSAPQFTPLVPATGLESFYEVTLSSAKLGTTSINLTGHAVADTGTSLMIVPTVVENAFLSAVEASAGFKSLFPGKTLSETDCLDGGSHTDAEVDAALPALTVTLPAVGGGSMTLTVPATQSYLFTMQGGYCLGMAAVDGLPTILGDTFLRAFVTVFDIQNKQIGFAPERGCVIPDIDVRRHSLAPIKPPPYYRHGRPSVAR